MVHIVILHEYILFYIKLSIWCMDSFGSDIVFLFYKNQMGRKVPVIVHEKWTLPLLGQTKKSKFFYSFVIFSVENRNYLNVFQKINGTDVFMKESKTNLFCRFFIVISKFINEYQLHIIKYDSHTQAEI